MKHKIFLVFLASLVGLLMVGCSATSKNIKVQEPKSVILEKNKDKGSIVFTTMEGRLLSDFQAKIMEFNPKTYAPTYLGTFNEMESFVHHVSPGKHYYFIHPVGLHNEFITTKRIVSLDIKPGDVVHVNSLLGSVIPESRQAILSKLRNLSCTSKDLKRYGFKIDSENKSELESDFLSFEVKCEGQKVVDVKDTRAFTFNDVEQATLVIPSQDSLKDFYEVKKLKNEASRYVLEEGMPKDEEKYLADIKELFPTFVNEHKNVFQYYNQKGRWFPSFQMFSIDVQETTNDEHANAYGKIILSPENEIGGIEKKYAEQLNNGITEKITNLPSDPSDTVIIKYEIENYVHGNQATRYFGLTDSQRLGGMSSLLLNVSFIDAKTGATVGKIKYVSVLFGGLFGGTVGLLTDASEHITRYAKMNYLE